MKLHELISPIIERGNPHLDKHMDTEYGNKRKSNTNRLPSSADLNLDLDKSDSSSNMTSDFTKSDALNILKSVVKKARGKEPIIKTKGGTNISVDAFGDEKSINFKKTF